MIVQNQPLASTPYQIGTIEFPINNAPILILDEATSALDNQSDQLIQEALVRLAEDRTTLIIAHRMGTLKDVERRLYFEDGKIAGDGNHEHIIEAAPGYNRLVNSEMDATGANG